jgi:hypothetical protein
MPARQLHLFAPPRPLLERLGADFFHGVPRAPGVYIMTARERLLYIGQSKNLRARLGSYKNARPDRAPRKIIRLIHQVDSIVWEKCENAAAARLRENELLRLHRPKFNSVGTYPKAYTFFWMRRGLNGLEIGRTNEPEPGAQLFGAFKTRALAGYGALLRLLWAVLHPPASPFDAPALLLSTRPPRSFMFGEFSGPAARLLDSLPGFLEGTSEEFVVRVRELLPPAETLPSFQAAFQRQDLEILGEFYRFGPGRNSDLRRQARLSAPLIPQEALDDLLVLYPSGADNHSPAQQPAVGPAHNEAKDEVGQDHAHLVAVPTRPAERDKAVIDQV